MNKILTRIVGAVAGLAMAIGAGFVIANNNKQAKPVNATENEATYRHVFSAKPSTGNNITLSDVKWNISATELGNYNSANYAGVQIGTSKKAGSITLTSSNAWGELSTAETYYGKTVVTEIRLWLNTGGSDVTPSVTIGGTAAVSDGTEVVKNSSAGSDWTKATLVTFTPASNHNTGIVVVDVQSVKAGYICAMEIDCEEPDTSTPTVTVSPDSLFIRTGASGQTVTASASNFSGDISYSWAYQSGTDCADLTNNTSATVTIAPKNSILSRSTGVYRVTATHDSESATADVTVTVDNGGSSRPYTVAEARAAIDSNLGKDDAYVSGIVSGIVTAYNPQGGFISYNISADGLTTSDQLQAYKGKSFNGDNFTSADDIKVGAAVTIFGTLKKYNSTYEFDQNNELVSYTTPYTVSFETNGGTETDSQIVLDGQKVQRPADPTKADDENNTYSFANWYASSDFNGDPYDFDTPVTADLVLYAKWNVTPLPAKTIIATKSTSASLAYSAYEKHGVGALDTLDRALTGISGNSYSDWTSSSNSGVSYKGQSAGGNDSIQLRTDNSNSGVVTTANTNNYNATSITLIWNAATSSGRVLDIYGKNEAYSAATDLYNDEEKGTLLGSLNFNDKDASNKSTLTIEGNYKFIGFRSNNKPLYLSSVSIQWGEPATYTYSNLGIRFGASISEELWNRLDTESDIQGYGVLLSTPEFLTGEDLKDYYDLADDISVKKFTNADTDHEENGGVKDIPTLKDGNYVWNLYKKISFANAAKNYVAVAFIQLAGDEVVFLNQVTANMKDLAQDLIDNDPNYDAQSFGGSLSYLANA